MRVLTVIWVLSLFPLAASCQGKAFLPFMHAPGVGVRSSIPIGDVLDQGLTTDKKEELQRLFKDLSDSLFVNPKSGELFLARAEVKIELGALRAALEDLDKAQSLGNQQYATYLELGVVNAALAQRSVALAYFRICLRRDSTRALTHYYVGATQLYLHHGTVEDRCHESIASLSEALRLDERLRDAWILRGCAFHRLGHYEEAIEDFTRALEFTPGEPTLIMLLGRSKLRQH